MLLCQQMVSILSHCLDWYAGSVIRQWQEMKQVGVSRSAAAKEKSPNQLFSPHLTISSLGLDRVYNRDQSSGEADRPRSPSRKHFKGRMAAKGVFSLVFVFACVATSQVYGKATDPPTTDPPTTDPPTTPHCECINPFTETEPDKAYR